MSFASLPDELLHHILTSCLAIPDAAFCAFPEDELSSNEVIPRHRRHPHALLVSKRFLRVGTPLLYEALNLATPAHVADVSRLLQRHETLGRAIRSLKLNRCAFGRGLETVCSLAPSVKTIFFDLRCILHDDPIEGFIAMLAKDMVDPETVYVLGKRKVESVSTKSVIVEWALCAALERWPSLRRVHLDAYVVTVQMPVCFARPTALEEVSVGSDLALSWLEGPYLHDVARNSRLKCIRIRDVRHKDRILELLRSAAVEGSTSLKLEALIVFCDDAAFCIC